ncbi:phosphatase PAP2 family protein [Pseudorhodobacter sp.]|uniref:phosphatase PAP2 family protein n=1 Tax=Pseudorhodobacter sp. TaxID=1934400 RepID=UPI0026490FD8|nr:phosphatase PAP2 family protein [Pseudorhodobacter sp.]MDN5787895.1 phosphatase PAP2 family protein [Pseudorhodobacter sp.]
MTDHIAQAPTLSAPDTRDIRLRFRLGCLAVSLTALALLFIARPSAGPALLSIASDYLYWLLQLCAVILCLHLVACCILVARKSKGLSALAWSTTYLRAIPITDFVCAMGAIAATIGSFTVYKSLEIGADGYHHDASFIALDRTLFGGVDPWQITHALMPSANLTWFLDVLYHPAFLPMILGYALCAMISPRPALRYTYITSYLICFVVIGMGLANLLNSAGPVFDGQLYGDGQTFGPLKTLLQAQSTAAGPFFSVEGQDYLLAARQQGVARIGSGISAMPSMHIVMAFLWPLAGWQINRWLGFGLTCYALLIWVASVHLGWHYASDGIVGLSVLLVIWLLVARFFGLYRPNPDAA